MIALILITFLFQFVVLRTATTVHAGADQHDFSLRRRKRRMLASRNEDQNDFNEEEKIATSSQTYIPIEEAGEKLTATESLPEDINAANCTVVSPLPIWKQTIGNLSESFTYLNDAVEITATASKSSIDSVTFVINQIWLKEGAPMIAVHYPSGKDRVEVCDMETSDTTNGNGTTGAFSSSSLIEFGSTTQEYIAQCSHGYADIGVYLYVGPTNDDFNVQECEACSAPNMNYVGYYLTLPCVVMCENTTNPPKEKFATVVPSIEKDYPEPLCREDVTLFRQIGVTEFPVDNAVKIISQNTQSVTVELTQAWTTTTAIDQIYTSFKDTIFNRKCFESINIEEGSVYDTVTIMCNALSPKAYLEICLVDDIANNVLTMNDSATVPKCCQPEIQLEKQAVCYLLEINCDSVCIDETQQRKD